MHADSIEFWQATPGKVTDRILFRKARPDEEIDSKLTHRGVNDWYIERLSP